MFVTIRLFARLREIAGNTELRRELPAGSTVEAAWNHLTREFPDLAAHQPSVSCAVNEEYARMSSALRDGDELAFLPPVSGG